VHVEAMKSNLKAPETKRLTLKHDKPLTNVAFKFNLRRYIEVQSDAAQFAACLERTGAVAERRAAAGARRMRNAKTSRVFHAWRLASEKAIISVRVETLTRMLYESQDQVAQLNQDLQTADAVWEQRCDAVGKISSCRNLLNFMQTCRSAICAWSRRARRTSARHIRGASVPEERPNHPAGVAFRARVARQRWLWPIGGLADVEARWAAPPTLDHRKRIVHNGGGAESRPPAASSTIHHVMNPRVLQLDVIHSTPVYWHAT
jgi:hypothetical protein